MSWVAVAVAASAVVGGAVSSDASRKAANTQADAAKNATNAQLSMFNQTQANLQPYMQTGQNANALLSFLTGTGPQPTVGGTPGTPATQGQFIPNPDAVMSDGGTWVDKNTGTPLAGVDPATGRPGSFAPGTPATPGTPGQPIQLPQGLSQGSFLQPFGMQQFQQSPAYQFNLQQGQMAIDKAAASRGNYYAPQTLQDISKFSQGLASNEFQNAFSNYQTNLGNIWNRLSGLSGSGQNAADNLGGFGTQVGSQVGSNIIGAGNALAAGQVGQANAVTGSMSNAYNAYLMNQILSQNQQGSNANNVTYIQQ